MDQFILDCATGQGINLQNYGLPSELEAFTKITKDVKAKNDHRFKSLFMALDNCKEIAKLRSVLNYMNDNQSRCDATDLQRLFEEK